MTGSDRPKPKSPAISAQMKRIRRESTAPELALRKELFARGLRYRVNLRGVPGTPDIAFTRAKIAVFVDGCFWHSCPEHATVPKNNREWWVEKLRVNVERDRRKDRALEDAGWLPVRVWEHESPDEAADMITHLWRARIRGLS